MWPGQAVILKTWTAIDPVANRVRLKMDGVTGRGDFDVTIPGGPAWSVNSRGTTWSYKDPTGASGGVTQFIVWSLVQQQTSTHRSRGWARPEQAPLQWQQRRDHLPLKS